MKKLVVDKKLTEVNFDTFKDLDSKTEEIVLPEGLKTIKSETFYDNIYIKSIILPKSLEVIETNAFYGLDGLKRIKLSSKIKKIEKEAFCNCVNLTIEVEGEKLPKGWDENFYANIKGVKYGRDFV